MIILIALILLLVALIFLGVVVAAMLIEVDKLNKKVEMLTRLAKSKLLTLSPEPVVRAQGRFEELLKSSPSYKIPDDATKGNDDEEGNDKA